MTPKKADLRQQMNDALNGALPEDDMARMHARLQESETSSEQWERLRQTDELLHTTPMVSPPRGFADRVMAAIMAIATPEFMRRELSAGVALGLVAVAILAIPVLSVALFAVLSVVADPGALHAVFQTVLGAASYVAELIVDLGERVKDVAGERLVVTMLFLTVVVTTVFWGWLLRHLFNKQLVRRRSRF